MEVSEQLLKVSFLIPLCGCGDWIQIIKLGNKYLWILIWNDPWDNPKSHQQYKVSAIRWISDTCQTLAATRKAFPPIQHSQTSLFFKVSLLTPGDLEFALSPKLASDLWFSYRSLTSAGITGMYHCPQTQKENNSKCCMYVRPMCVGACRGQKKGARALELWVTGAPGSYWELDMGPLGEQQAFKSLRHLSGPQKKFLNDKILSSRRHKTRKYISDKIDISSV